MLMNTGTKLSNLFLGMGRIARCTVSTAGPRGTRSRSQSDSSSPGKTQCGFPSHEHWLLSSHRPSWRGVCCLHDFFPAQTLSGSLLMSGMTNQSSPLEFSSCKFFPLPKCSDHHSSVEPKNVNQDAPSTLPAAKITIRSEKLVIA